MHFYAANEERLQWLKEDLCHYIEKIQIESKRASLQGLTKETAEALLFTANSTVQCVVHLLDNGFFMSSPEDSLAILWKLYLVLSEWVVEAMT